MTTTNENGFNQLATILISLFVCLTLVIASYHNYLGKIDSNERNERIEAIRVDKQHELEVTKQKSIEMDKSRKRKIWERAMPSEKDMESDRGH